MRGNTRNLQGKGNQDRGNPPAKLIEVNPRKLEEPPSKDLDAKLIEVNRRKLGGNSGKEPGVGNGNGQGQENGNGFGVGKALACPVEEDGSCLTDTRKADLLAKFGIPITSTSGYDDLPDGYDKLPDLFLQSFGFAVPNSGNRLIINDLEGFSVIDDAYRIPISNFNCIEEAFALGASVCNENEFCTYFSANQFYDKIGYDVEFRFFSAESETATSDGTAIENGPNDVSGFPGKSFFILCIL